MNFDSLRHIFFKLASQLVNNKSGIPYFHDSKFKITYLKLLKAFPSSGLLSRPLGQYSSKVQSLIFFDAQKSTVPW